MSKFRPVAAMLAAALTLAGCGRGAESESTGDVEPGTASTPAPASASARPGAESDVQFAVAATGNTARYRVREQLVRRDLPNDAIGETSEISGTVTVDGSGQPVRAQSRIVVRTGSFKSDSDRRDGYVRRRLFVAEEFPTVELVPTAIRGLTSVPAAGATSGPLSFQVLGDLTIKGVTRPTTWQVTARQEGNRLTGQAKTAFTFADFGLTQPRVPVVLSVADTIRLEYDFTLERR